MLGGTFGNAYSADQETIRVRIGLKLFRTILAADMHIHEKQDSDGKLPLAIVYKSNLAVAETYSEKLRHSGKGDHQGEIKGLPITVDAIAVTQLEQLPVGKYAGIYIVETLDSRDLQFLVSYGIAHQRITYSPFDGAVEQGIAAGLMIAARVTPYVNVQTLKASKLQIKPFFLKVSKRYEP